MYSLLQPARAKTQSAAIIQCFINISRRYLGA
jgi:hypothetical protein